MGLFAQQFCTFFAFLCKELLFGYIFHVKIVFAKPVVLAIKCKAKFHVVTHDKQEILFVKANSWTHNISITGTTTHRLANSSLL